MPEMINNLVSDNNILKRKPDENVDLNVSKKAKTDVSQRKRMCAMMLMYSGVGYFGMQRNEGFKTIEGDILQAMLDSEIIDEEIFKKPCKMRFQRASKTDKNVSAIGQVCSLKLPQCENVVKLVNDKLPPHIRILDVFRTTKSFHAKGLCKYRTYRYLTPSFAFSPKELHESELHNFRITDDILNKVNMVLSCFKGTHNFHNFTSGRLPADSSCKRFLISLTCEPAFVNDACEYVTIVINGQSFMLHQIRKMIGLTMAVLRGFCNEEIFNKVFTLMKVDIPKAPGLGLVLDRVNYDSYNQKYANEGRKPIDWTLYQNQIEEFRLQYVYSHIFKVEKEEKSMIEWLNTLSLHTYDYRDPITDKGL